MSTKIEYVNAAYQEGMVGNMKVSTSIETMHVTCLSCGEKISRDVWDQSPSGHEACGLFAYNFHCYECNATTVIHVHEGCIVCQSTEGCLSDLIPEGQHRSIFDLPFQDTPSVGTYSHQHLLGQKWNVEENRRKTHQELYPRLPRVSDEVDDIPF